MTIVQLVCVEWISEERDKHIWEDLYSRSWDEIIGRMYLLKANSEIEDDDYEAALTDFKRATALLAKKGVKREYYARALADKALAQCCLDKYDKALATIDKALAVGDESYESEILKNQGAILVLAGLYSEALNVLSTQLEKDSEDSDLRFTLATCLLHLERYDEAVVAYEQVMAEGLRLGDEGLIAARLGQQPDWHDL